MYELLNQVHSPMDLHELDLQQLEVLCKEIRRKLLYTVATNGGHLSSNLGTVELTVALHRIFSLPEDQIVWDVGHQAYTHKMLTGRLDELYTIRQEDGLCGFPNRQESPYDAFTVGHSSTSISAALGIAKAKELRREPGKVIAVIGDGALTGGMAYEGLNNAGRDAKNLIVILNDNTMSISQNVGSITGHLTKLRTLPLYLKAKGDVETALSDLPVLGEPLYHMMRYSKNLAKKAFHNTTLFEDLGFSYYGPINGHDMGNLLEVLRNARAINKPVLLHVVTQKGRGYRYAELNPGAFHGVSSFDLRTGQSSPSSRSFSSVFGKAICDLAKEDSSICAITAAMQTGTGLNRFAATYPKRFFDVGIAEEHAVTFAGGLSVAGMKPVCAVYSTFLQRAYDQILHDAALQQTKVVLAIDRAGIVGEDGATHQGVFDVPFLNTIPNVTVFAPSFYAELERDLRRAFYEGDCVSAVRYPRGKELYRPKDFVSTDGSYDLYGDADAKITVVTYGRLFSHACEAREQLSKQGIPLRIVKLNQIKPIDPAAVAAAAECETVLFLEEGILQGGVGERFLFLLQQGGWKGSYTLRGVDDMFVGHASVARSLQLLGLDVDSIVKTIQELTNGAKQHG